MGALVTSPEVQRRALSCRTVVGLGRLLGDGHAGVGRQCGHVTTGATVTAESPSASAAAQAANAYAEAIINLRKDRERALIDAGHHGHQAEARGLRHPSLKQSTDYILLQQRLRDLEILDATVTGDFRVVAPAQTPTAPFAPRPHA